MARRPIAVWITQAFLAIMIVACLGMLAYVCFQIAAAVARPEIPRRAIALYAFNVLIRNSLLLGFMVVTFWGLHTARNYGKWLGVAFLLLCWAVGLYSSLHPVQGPLPSFSINYANPSELAGAVIGEVLITAGFFILAFELSFGKSCKKFFASGGSQPESENS